MGENLGKKGLISGRHLFFTARPTGSSGVVMEAGVRDGRAEIRCRLGERMRGLAASPPGQRVSTKEKAPVKSFYPAHHFPRGGLNQQLVSKKLPIGLHAHEHQK